MRFVELTVPIGQRDATIRELDSEGIDYVVTEETGSTEYAAIITFPLPQSAVEPMLDRLREVGVDEHTRTVVLDARTVVSERFEQLSEQYAEGNTTGERIAREELETEAENLAPSRRTYVTMTVVSAVIATAGLLLDSPAVIVGSMVIAPLIGPAMAASVGTVIDDRDLFVRGVQLQALGLGLAVVSAVAFAVLVRATNLIPPVSDIASIPAVRERVAPDFLSLAVAIGAGVAGAVSLTTGTSSAIVGVMIAVALMPPAATIGLGLAWGQPIVSLGAGILLLVNVLSINLAALVVLWTTGYRPQDLFRLDEAQAATAKRVATLVVAIAVLSVFLGGVTYLSYQSTVFQQQAEAELTEMLDEPPYERLTLLDSTLDSSETTIAFDEVGLATGEPVELIVSIDRPADSEYPRLAEAIDRRLTRETGREVAIEVRFVDAERTT